MALNPFLKRMRKDKNPLMAPEAVGTVLSLFGLDALAWDLAKDEQDFLNAATSKDCPILSVTWQSSSV